MSRQPPGQLRRQTLSLALRGGIGLLCSLLVLLAPACRGEKPPLRLGFIGSLTGRMSDVGISGRDAALLAVEEINREGGVGGRRVVLSIKDAGNDPGRVGRLVEEFAREDAVAIVGPFFSSMAVAAVAAAGQERILLLSPTASTNALNGRDDWLYRTYPKGSQTFGLLGRYAHERLGCRRAFVVHETSNRAYTQSALHTFREAFEEAGGTVVGDIGFRSGPKVHFTELGGAVAAAGADSVLILAAAMDTAMLAQAVHKLAPGHVHGSPGRSPGSVHPRILTGDWSVTDEILRFGGAAVEGLTVVCSVDLSCSTPRYRAFRDAYQRRYGRLPGFSAIHAYDTTMALARALRVHADPHALRQTLTGLGSIEGLQGSFRFDETGDVVRAHFPQTIHGGRFILAGPPVQ